MTNVKFKLRAVLIGLGSLVDLDGRTTQRRMQNLLDDISGRYYCPTSGDVEDPQHGGFDVCCARPDLHVPVGTQP